MATTPAISNSTVPLETFIAATTAPTKRKPHHTIKPTQNLTLVPQPLNGFASAMHAAGNKKEKRDDFTSNR